MRSTFTFLTLLFLSTFNAQTVTDITTNGIVNLRIIRVVGGELYVSQFANASFDSSSGRIIQINQTNGTETDITTGIVFPVGLDTDGTNLYQGSEDSDEGLYQISDLTSNPNRTLIDEATNLSSCSVVYDNNILYFVSFNDSAVYSLDLQQANPTAQLVYQDTSLLSGAQAIAKNGNDIYVGTSNGTIVRVNISGTATASNYFTPSGSLIDMQVRNGYLYYVGTGTDVSRINLSVTPATPEIFVSTNAWSFDFTNDALFIVRGDSSFSTTIARVDGLNLSTSEVNSKTEGAFIYPVPATDVLHLKSNDITYSTYQIYDSNGRLIKSAKFNERQEINVSDLNFGIYLIHYSDGKNSWSDKFTVR